MTSGQGIPDGEDNKAKGQENKGNLGKRMNFDNCMVSIGVGAVQDKRHVSCP